MFLLKKIQAFPREIISAFLDMKLTGHALYWMTPLITGFIFLLMYYVGTPFMQEIIAPAGNREFGLLENSEHLLLLVVNCLLFWNILHTEDKKSRAGYALAFAWFTFVLLEEVDYGLHWLEAFKNVPEEQKVQVRNIHNMGGGVMDLIKAAGNISMAGIFIVIPYFVAVQKIRYKWLWEFIPSRRMVFSLLVVVIVGYLASVFEDMDFATNGSLAGNRAEFDETMTYYVFFVYLLELTRNKKEKLVRKQALHSVI